MSINGIVGGTNTLGVIDNTGLYTAPIAVPAPASIQVEAISVADISQSAIAQRHPQKFRFARISRYLSSTV